ncbi:MULTISPECIES: CoA-binding protein [Bacillaceae]|nr:MULTISPECIES: CoA-binding protein [Bacillaceae]
MAYEQPTKEEIKEIFDHAKRIAVVGLSEKPEKTSYEVSKVMQEEGYEIIPVNPNAEEVLGVKAVNSLEDIDGHIDIVNVFRRSEHLPEVAREAASIDADVFWAQLGLENDEAYQIAKEAGMKVVMDRCIKVEHAITR